MDNRQRRDVVAVADDKGHKQVETWVATQTWQGRRKLNGSGEYPQRAADSSRITPRERPARTLNAGSVIPWQDSFEHPNLEHEL